MEILHWRQAHCVCVGGVNKNYNREIRRGGQKMGVVTKRVSLFFYSGGRSVWTACSVV